MYSFKTSFWTVPVSFALGVPRRSATATTSESRIIAVALIVIERLTRSSGIPWRSRSMSSIVEIATPARQRRDQRVLHLHRLDNHDRPSRFDLLSLVRQYLHDQARHRGVELAAGGVLERAPA